MGGGGGGGVDESVGDADKRGIGSGQGQGGKTGADLVVVNSSGTWDRSLATVVVLSQMDEEGSSGAYKVAKETSDVDDDDYDDDEESDEAHVVEVGRFHPDEDDVVGLVLGPSSECYKAALASLPSGSPFGMGEGWRGGGDEVGEGEKGVKGGMSWPQRQMWCSLELVLILPDPESNGEPVEVSSSWIRVTFVADWTEEEVRE